MPKINLGTKENFGLNSTDAPTENFPTVFLDAKPAEMLDQALEGADEFMALVKISVGKRTEVTKKKDETDFDFDRGPVRFELDLMGLTVVPDTRKGKNMKPKMEQMNQNFKRNTPDRMMDKAAVDAGLDMVMEGINKMK